ncbi:glycosyltransferase [Limosilactobacillus fermentum]|uniref:glycosyltransferase n=1 Tax=Limosilactobacillus fermentum TaxID=1613 RepID=UPI002A6ABF03|nr:glycosyltransferase [Limosilactobacillus fermentum]WPP07486.1 glycosyltransferase [Limosilactobacillus fermentum]WRS44368.1 glycosyltransferase [Limosilactobacillus fermentum]
MLFFFNDNIQENKSGIEHAQIKRLNLFKKFNQPAKIVLRQYSNELHHVTNAAGIDDADLVNLFDYFQEARLVKAKKVTLQDLTFDPRWKRRADGVSYNYYDGDRRVIYVRRHQRDKHVMNVQYFDRFGKLVKVSWYDNRGFLSVDQLYDWSNQITVQNYFTPTHRLAMTATTTLDKRQKETTVYHLYDYQGQDLQFANFDELTRFFYDQIANDRELTGPGPVGCIVDRSYELGWAVLNMKTRIFRVLQLHNDHVNNPADMLHSPLNYNYDWGLRHLSEWDGVIALTPSQQVDVTDRFGKVAKKVYRVPGAIVPDERLAAKHIPMKKRHRHEVIVIARLSPEKQQDHLLEVWPQILKAVPDAQLNLWGYSNDNFDQKLKQMVKDEHLEKSVHFRGYTTDVGKVNDEAQLMVLPSSAEGLPLSLVEGQSHGLPIVANDIKYGPRDIIVDGQDGILTQNGDKAGLAAAIIDLLEDDDKRQRFSDQAYQDSERYSEANVMKLWQEIIDDMNEGAAK